MVLPLPQTLLHAHPCLLEPPPEFVKHVLPYRRVLTILLFLHALVVVALLVSPAPHVAMAHCFSLFLGVCALRSTMPLRYSIYAGVTLYVCLASLVRFVDRIPLPEFGNSRNYRIYELAKLIHQIVEDDAKETGKERLTVIFPPEAEGHEAVAKIDASTLRQFLGRLQQQQARPSVTPSHQPAADTSYLRKRPKESTAAATPEVDAYEDSDDILLSYAHDDSHSSLVDISSAHRESTSRQRMAPVSFDTHFWSPFQSQYSPPVSTIRGYSFLTVNASSSLRALEVEREALAEVVYFTPTLWRSQVEMVATGTAAIVTGLSATVAFICARKIKEKVHDAISHSLGIDGTQDGSMHPLIPPSPAAADGAESPPAPYLYDPMGERASPAYRPFLGEGVTLEGWLAQSGQQRGSAHVPAVAAPATEQEKEPEIESIKASVAGQNTRFGDFD